MSEFCPYDLIAGVCAYFFERCREESKAGDFWYAIYNWALNRCSEKHPHHWNDHLYQEPNASELKAAMDEVEAGTTIEFDPTTPQTEGRE